MKLSEKNIEAFQVLFMKHFGREISKEEAREKGAKLLRLMQLVYKPMTQAEFDAVQERRKELNP
jgi:urease accessory protein UreF